MSKVEEGNLFFRRFTRVALALSMVTSSFVLADQNIDANASGTKYLGDDENNASIASFVDGDGAGANVTVNAGVNVSGAIVAGENTEAGALPGGQPSHVYRSGHDSTGTAMGLDINGTITNLANLGTIGASVSTLASYTDDNGDIHHPDQNNTTLMAAGVKIGSAIDDKVINSGTISATATLNNDTNNSEAKAAGIFVGATIGKGIVNTGTITATASTHDRITDDNGHFVENRLVASIGGRDGNGGIVDTKLLGDKARYVADLLHDQNDAKVGSDSTMVVANNNLKDTAQTNTRMVSDTRRYDDRLLDRKDGENKHHDNYADQSLDTDKRSDYNDQFHIVDSTGQHMKDRMQEQNFIRTDNGGDNNSHMHVGNYTPANLGSPGTLDNVIVAAGINVEAEVTGGIIDHNYISSVVTSAALTGSSDGNEVGLTVTPNSGALAGADTSALDPDATVPATPATPDTPDIPPVSDATPISGGGATGSAGGVTYDAPAADNGILPEDDTYGDDTLAAILATKATEEEALPDEPTDAEIDAVKLSDADLAEIKADIAKAYRTGATAPDSPEEPEEPAHKPAPPTAAAGAAPTDGFKDGVHTARIGNTLLNGATNGGAAQGILVRATSDTNLNDEINATTGALSASDGENGNRNSNANVTSGTVSAYLGEGVRDGNSRVISIDKNSTKRAGDLNRATDYNRLSNDLIGGLENNGAVLGGAGAAGMTLRSDATAVADRAEGININQYGVTNDGTTTYTDIKSNPTSIVGVGTLMNTATITGGMGGSGLEVLANSTGGISAADANISGHELIVSPTAITNVREVINHGDIVGGMGGNAINGKAVALGSIKATDINVTAGNEFQTDGLTVRTHADATMGNFFSSGTVTQALGEDGMKMEADGKSELKADTITDSIVNIDTTSIGGVRKVLGKDGDNTKLTEGNLLNAGEISVALSAHAVNMHAEGLASLTQNTADTAVKNSNVNVRNETITGVEGNFVNLAWTDTNETSLEKSDVKRGKIAAALASDAIHLDAKGEAKLEPASIEGGTTDIKNISTSGVGETFANYGEVSVALAANGANFSADSTATLGKADTTVITAGVTNVTDITTAGVRGDFINGASAIETGVLKEGNASVHNPLADYTQDSVNNPTLIKEHDGYYEVAANINETNTSTSQNITTTTSSAPYTNLDANSRSPQDYNINSGDTNSTTAHANDVLAGNHSTDGFINQLEQDSVRFYDKEAAITGGKITAALATDAVKLESSATGNLLVKSIDASTIERIDSDDDSPHDTFATKAIVNSISASDASVGGDFINNGEISVALAADGINGKSTATGTLGSSDDDNKVNASTVTQYTTSRAGVKGDFLNEAVSREVGAGTVFAAQSGSKEIAAFTYNRATNIGEVKITAALAANAIQFESHATNHIDLLASNAATHVLDSIGSGTTDGEQSRNLAGWKTIAGATRSDINSTTGSISGIGENFSNTGLISVALAKNGVDTLADATNNLGTTTKTQIKGTNVISAASSVAGVQGDFTNDIHSLKDGNAQFVQRDVYDIDASNAVVSPKYYVHGDDNEGERVKSNVVDRVVYSRALAKGEITAALSADAITLDAEGTTNVVADYIGVSEVNVVTNHTGYSTAGEDNVTRVDRDGILDSDRVIKVTSEDVKASTVVVAGIGGQFTNRNIISSALAKNALTAMGTATTTLGQTALTKIEGGRVSADTLVISGIGNDANSSNHEGFLNAAGTYDEGVAVIGKSKVIAGSNDQAHLILPENINESIDANKTHMRLIDSHDVVYWNRQAPIVGEMSTALAKDVVKVDGQNTGKVVPVLITAVMGDVNVTTLGDSGTIIPVVGEHVEGTARATVSETTTVIAGINGGLTNQGKMTAALAGNVVMAEAKGAGTVGDATAEIKGSTVYQNTTTIAGVQDGDFVNETLSFDKDTGVVYTELHGNVETPTVAFDKATTDGSVEMSVALSKTVAELEALSDNKVEALNILASTGVKYGGGATTWEIGTILASAKTVTSDVNSSTTSLAGVSGNFYNSGKIDVALAKDGIDALADGKNAIGTRQDESIKGSNVIASSSAISGIRGDFTNDVVTLDDGAKYVIKKDVVDANGKNLYALSGATAPADRVKSNVTVNNIDDRHHEDENNSVFGVTKDIAQEDGVVYAQLIAEGEIGAALSGDAVKLDALGTNDVKPLAIQEAEVAVVRMDVQTGTKSNENIHATANRALTVDVTSDTTATTYVVAGIGGRFTNLSSKEIKASLAKNAITAIATATTTWGDAGNTEVHGGTHIANTRVVAGIGNGDAEHRGLYNLANSYNEAIHTANTTLIASGDVAISTGNAHHAGNANDAISTDENLSLPLMDSAEVVYWDNTIKVGKITTSLAKDAFNLEATATGSLTPKTALAVVNDVNVSETVQSVAGYHVTGSSVGADITNKTTSIAGIKGDFLNQGEISTALAGNVLNAKGTATGTVGDVGNTVVVGSKLDGTTTVIAGIQGGNFTNEVQSFDTAGNTVVTRVDASGKEVPVVVFNRESTDGQVKLGASLSKDVVLMDVTSTNMVEPKTVDASEYVMSIASSGDTLADAKTAKSTVVGRSYSLGGIDGNFYNSGIIEASLAKNAITSHATSDNDLGTGAITVHGADVAAYAQSYARINGDFVNDALLFDNDTSPTILMDAVSDTNATASNVAGSVVYEQQLVKGLIKSGLSKDVLSLIATGNNDINIADVGYTTVKVVNIGDNDLNPDANHTYAGEHNISSAIVAVNRADSGIGGILLNAGTMETATGTDVINLQAVGGPSTVLIGNIDGGSVDANNSVLSGINLAATSTMTFGDLREANRYTTILPADIDIKGLNIETEGEDRDTDIIGFLNDKRDFNTVLETDGDYDTAKVATGTIKADLAQTLVLMHATGGATSTITADTAGLYTTDVDTNSKYGTATVSNNNSNIVAIQGDFVNLGDMTTGTAGKILDMVATNQATNTVNTADAGGKGILTSSINSQVASYIDGDIINTGKMESGTAGDIITMQALGGTSAITAALTDVNATKWAADNGKVIASNTVTTISSAKHLFNSGTIKAGSGGKAIVLDASGTADSSAVSVANTEEAKNAVFVNHVTASATLASLTNVSLIQSDGADTITIHAEGTATRKYGTDVPADVNTSTYEDTSARVNASIGDIRNVASTRQNHVWEVDKAFNPDNNDTNDATLDQLHPLEVKVASNNGEYDLTTAQSIESNSSKYNESGELDRLAYSAGVDVNTTTAILSQRVGIIKAATSGNAIDIKATAHDSNSTLVTASTGHIVNSGIIDASAAGIGINISAAGTAGDATLNAGAKAIATTGIIANMVTDDTFAINDLASVVRDALAKPEKGDVIHAILAGNILGATAGIKIDAVGAADEGVSVATVDQIVNSRRVLNSGDFVISSAGADNVTGVDEAVADGKVKANADINLNDNANENGGAAAALTARADNYGIVQLNVDGVYNAVIGQDAADASSIIVGENAHVKDGILNYGELKGKVELGDADLHLYGLVQNSDHNETFGARPETDEMGLTDNYFAVKSDVNNSAYVAAEDHVQVAGMITTADPAKVTNAIVGSSITFHNSHVLNTEDATYNADHIVVPTGSIVNIDENTEFITGTTNPFDVNLSEGVHNMFTNSGYLNVRAGITAKVDGNYEQRGGFFVTNVNVASTPVSTTTAHSAAGGTTFGQLEVTGNADLTGGILVMLDDLDTDLTPAVGGDETRLVDVVKSANFTVGSDKNMTHAGGNYDADTAPTEGDANAAKVAVQDNSRVFDFESVAGTTAGDISLRIVAQDPNAAPISIDTTNVAISAIKSTARVIAARVDSRPSTSRPTYTFSGTPTSGARFTSTDNAPVSVPAINMTVNPPVGASVDTTGDVAPVADQPVGGNPRVTVLSQNTQTDINGELVLNAGADVKPSLSDYEISKNRELEQLRNENFNVWGKIFASSANQDGEGTSSDTKDANMVKTTQVQVGRAGYSATTYGIVAGADKQYGEWFVGTALSLAKSTADTDSGPSTSTDTTMFQVTEYGSHPMGEGRINVQASYAYLSNDKDRTDGYVGDGQGSDGKVYNADYDGYAISASAEYEQGFALNSDTTLIPYAGLTGTYVNNEGYTETGGDNAQEVSGAHSSALVVGLGSRATYKLSENSSLLGNVGIGYDMIAEQVDYEARTALNANSDTLHIEGAKPEELEYEVGLGYQFVTPSNTVIRASVDYTARDGYDDTTGSVKFYFPF